MSDVKCYCLTLRGRPGDGGGRTCELMAPHGIFPELVHGIDGAAWGLATTIPYADDGGMSYKIGASAIGNLMSHYLAWLLFERDGVEEALILEDDAIPCPDFDERLALARESLPEDWQWVHVGCLGWDDKPRRQVAGPVWVVEHPFGTHAYLLRRSALHVLLTTQQRAWAPVDIQLAKLAWPLLHTYTLLPSLVRNGSQDWAYHPDGSRR